ncbi:MAG: twin-arginine translocase subunit TatC [Cytophagales bacterium]|jgi:sec-independent protein translocase protein TatC|nr:twin-arginine translocase subunit TatC [Cytophagales bacterium]MCA6388713.1 twin-arginine translocase subunit TatC [Cytophagales bacterium]MCA6391966.1 twin-arginine translocase subunit TatC [Cytophagales bacterium]MCA6396007.1 twin-arginine translocase subunit TatC [Cytophagales bacterium]MCA6397459.1 twin-arginine translocase subunit TatC [Cytophagales bacterium]
MAEEKEMAFLDHLEELRWHVVRSVSVILIAMIACFAFIKEIFEYVIFAPAKINFPTFKYMCELGKLFGFNDLCVTDLPFKLQSRNMTGQFMMSLTASFVIGLIVAFPYVAWELWRFVKPGLQSKEIKYSKGAVFAVSFLFSVGILFGYYILAPTTIWFLATYSISDMIVNEFDITSYVSTIASLILGCGILFQFPMVIYFLSKVGIVTPELMRKYRKHSIVVILILGAVITPSGDPFSLTVISLPLYVLFEISIYISSVVVKRKLKQEAAELRADQQNS